MLLFQYMTSSQRKMVIHSPISPLVKKRCVVLLLVAFLILPAVAVPQSKGVKLWVELTDKQTTPYSLSNPEAFLSQRAIERRQEMGIAIDSTDLPVVPAYVDSIRQTGVEVLYASRWMNAVAVQTGGSKSVLKQIQQMPFVSGLDTVALLSSGKRYRQRDKFQKDYQQVSSPIEDFYGFAANQVRMLNGHRLHNLGFTGKDVRIAVMDAGFFKANELPVFAELRAEDRILDTYDFVEGHANVYDEGYHGSEVLSTMAGFMPGRFVGTAPDAAYMLYRTEDVNSEYLIEEHNWIAAAERADSAGADIFNISLGYTEFNDSTMDHTYADLDGNTAPITRAADMAASKGILVVNSAGNAGRSPWHYISAPADGDSVVAVGAVKPDSSLAGFSSRGPTSNGQVKPNIAAQGQATVIYHPAEEKLLAANGTSFSSPLAAGMFACLLQTHSSKGAWPLVEEVQRHASNAPEPDTLTGYGIPDFYGTHLALIDDDDPRYQENRLPRAYPNPVNDRLHVMINNDKPQDYRLTVVSLTGREVVERKQHIAAEGFHKFQFPVFSQLSEGLYFLHIKSEQANHTLRIWKGDGF
jgi:hypothetical protein